MDGPPQPTSNLVSSRTRSIFIGPFGLRAGWSLLLYFGIVSLVAGSLWFAGQKFAASQAAEQNAARQAAIQAGKPAPVPQPSLADQANEGTADHPVTLSTMIAFEAFAFGLLFLISFIMARIERRSVFAFGLCGPHILGRLLVGFVFGILAMSVIIALLALTHTLTFDRRLLHGPAILGWGLAQLLAFLLVGFTEEYMYRGYLQFTLTRGLVSIGNLISRPHARAIAFSLAGIVTCIVFRFAHTGLRGENTIGLLQIPLIGALCLVTLWRTGSLWWGIGFHAAWDWAQSFLYGVPDSGDLMQGRLFATHASGNPILSGAADGPEGSIYSLIVLALIAIAAFILIKPSPQPSHETQSDPPTS